MSIIRRLERMEKARQAQRIAALDSLVRLFTPDEIAALEATLEAGLAGRPAPSDIERQTDVAFARVWAEMTPEDREMLVSSTVAAAW